MRWLVVFVFLLSACAPRGDFVSAGPPPGGTERDIFIATSRTLTSATEATADRSLALSFARVQLGFPQGRPVGDNGLIGRRFDPVADIVATEAERFGDAGGFRAALSRSLAEMPTGRRDAVIYVHGFNNTYAEGVIRIGQLAEDLGVEAVSLHYAWPSAASALGYGHDRESVLFARDGLERMIEEVRLAGADEILLIGHSLGGLASVETLRQIDIAEPGRADRLVEGVVLVSPDIDPDVFVAQLSRFETVPEPFVIFASERDRALRLSARLNGSGRRLGNIPDITTLAEFPVTVIDVTRFSNGGTGHFVPGDSEVLLSLLSNAREIDRAFAGDSAGRTGLLPGTVLTIQNATEIILTPVQSLN